MVRTRVGYAGGTRANPTYHALGDHSETVQLDYDPAVVTYTYLLDIFWSSHAPTSPAWSRQYASIIFFHDEAQRRLAEESRNREAARRARPVYSEILPYRAFYRAEAYHQKYYLGQDRILWSEMETIYPDARRLVDSTAAARINGYVGGYGSAERLEREIDLLGLSPLAANRLWQKVGGRR